MAGASKEETIPDIAGGRVLIVEARFYSTINDLLLSGARRMLERGGARHETITVPGALEIPPAIKIAVSSGRYQGFVAIGCVIRGATTHYELVANESCRGIMDLGTQGVAAIGNGILTVENEDQALERADPMQQDKGGHAALAALQLIELSHRLRG